MPMRSRGCSTHVFERHGRLDLLVNNAGGQFPQAAIDFTVKGWNAVIDTNLNGSWYMMQAAARQWRDAAASPAISSTSSPTSGAACRISRIPRRRGPASSISPRSIAVEWAPLKIRVNCVAPGCCETSAFGLYPPEGAASFEQSNPMKRAGDAWDIAEAVVYLAAPSGKFVTGETLTVDGGQQLWGDPWAVGRPRYFELEYEKSRLASEK